MHSGAHQFTNSIEGTGDPEETRLSNMKWHKNSAGLETLVTAMEAEVLNVYIHFKKYSVVSTERIEANT